MLERLGLVREDVRRRWSRAIVTPQLPERDRARRRRPRALRDRDPPPPAHGGARGRGAVQGRAEGLVGDAAQAQPDHDRADHRHRAAVARLRAHGLENVALWHERDISHSSAERVALPDASILLDYAQALAVRVVEGMTVHTERMRANLDVTSGALFSQRALLALVETGMSRDDAYRIVQENAQKAWDTGTPFRELLDRGT